MHSEQLSPDKTFSLVNSRRPSETAYQQRIRLVQQLRQSQMEHVRQRSPMLEIRPTRLFTRELTPVTAELPNLQDLLKDGKDVKHQDENNLSAFFDNNPHQELKNPIEEFQTSFANSFYQKRAVTRQGERTKATSMSIIQPPPPSRNGGQRQKLVLKVSDPFSSLNRSSSGTALKLFPNNLFEVKGRRVNIQDQTSLKAGQQKLYLKNFKQDPLRQYRSQGREDEKSTINLSQLLNSRSSSLALKQSRSSSIFNDKKSLLYKSMTSFLQDGAPSNNSLVYNNGQENTNHEEESKQRVKSFLLDGSILKSTKAHTPNLYKSIVVRKHAKTNSLCASLSGLRLAETKIYL